MSTTDAFRIVFALCSQKWDENKNKTARKLYTIQTDMVENDERNIWVGAKGGGGWEGGENFDLKRTEALVENAD